MSAVPFILIAVTLGVVGQLFIKIGLNSLRNLDFSTGLLVTYVRIFTSLHVVSGTFIYIVSVFFWLYALSKAELSFAYPFLALSYVFVLLASTLFLGETVPVIRWLGVSVICFGVFLVSRS